MLKDFKAFILRGNVVDMAVGVLIGAASQALDSFVTPTKWEFVAEESLKMTAEPFFIAAFLTALATVLARQSAAGTAPAQES